MRKRSVRPWRHCMSEANKQVMCRIAAEVLSANNLAAATQLVAPDVVDHSAFPGQPPGLEGMRQRWPMLPAPFPDFKITVHAGIAEAALAARRPTGTGPHAAPVFGIPR